MSINKFDKRMFAEARKVAQTSGFENFHMGCVIVYKKKIIGTGSNNDKTHPAQAYYNKYRKFNKTRNGIKHSIHAEIAALYSVSYPIGLQVDWNKVKVYVYRICPGREHGAGLSRPCPACRQALKDFGIKHIYYTTNDGYAYEKII